jgi:tetratricopeptide (TPR) repeat protein
MTRAAVFLFALTIGSGSALAQITGPTPPPSAERPPAAGNLVAPSLEAVRARRLDELYSRLREATDPRQARVIEREIDTQMVQSGSDTADLLTARATEAYRRNDHDLSLALFDTVVDLYPDYVEGWSRRASVHFARKEYGAAVADLEQVLAREPRYFGAYVGLGMIFQQLGEDRPALTAFRRAIEINPHIERIPEIIRRLGPKVDGRDL